MTNNRLEGQGTKCIVCGGDTEKNCKWGIKGGMGVWVWTHTYKLGHAVPVCSGPFHSEDEIREAVSKIGKGGYSFEM